MATTSSSSLDLIVCVLDNIIDELELSSDEQREVQFNQNSKINIIAIETLQKVLFKLEKDFKIINIRQICAYTEKTKRIIYQPAIVTVPDRAKIYAVLNTMIKRHNLDMRIRNPLSHTDILTEISKELASKILLKLSYDEINKTVILNEELKLKGFYESENLDLFIHFMQNQNKIISKQEYEQSEKRTLKKAMSDVVRGFGLDKIDRKITNLFFIKSGNNRYTFRNNLTEQDIIDAGHNPDEILASLDNYKHKKSAKR